MSSPRSPHASEAADTPRQPGPGTRRASSPLPRGVVLDLANRHPRFRLTRRRVEQAVALALGEGTPAVEVDVAVVTDAEFRRLNRRFLGCRGTSDVLSFDLTSPEERRRTWQIVLNADRAERVARRGRYPVSHELLLYLVHGILHHRDYDDSTFPARARMRARQDVILERLGLKARSD